MTFTQVKLLMLALSFLFIDFSISKALIYVSKLFTTISDQNTSVEKRIQILASRFDVKG